MERSSKVRWTFLLGVLVSLLAPVARWGIAPLLGQLPADYAEETAYAATSRFRPTLDAPWEEHALIARRVDQTLLASAQRLLVQGDLHWTSLTGEILFETSAVFGVDRGTRANLAGYGNVDRAGQFLFPAPTEAATYSYWDPMWVGTREAHFERRDTLEGVPVHVFRFLVRGLDETDGYLHLPDVPQRYRMHSDGEGTLWIEPTSGVVVDYEERGRSGFVEPASGTRVGDAYVWEARYTPATRSTKLAQATAERWRSLFVGTWLPIGLLLLGVVAMVGAGLGILRRRTRPQRAAAAAVAGEAGAEP